MKKILFLNNTVNNCGCYQVGFKSYNTIKNSTKYEFIYRELSSEPEFRQIVNETNPDSIILNYHPIIMPWVSKRLMDEFRYLNPICFVHEYLGSAPRDVFHWYINSDTGAKEEYKDFNYVFVVGRCLDEYSGEYQVNKVPTFGSYGFAFPVKRFDVFVSKVQEEYDEAIINLHMPNANYGDADSSLVRLISEQCRNLITKPGITLNITTDFRNEEESLEFLAGNDMNCFFYANTIGKGVSSSLDPALSVKRPIAVSKTYMFRHVTDTQPSICIEDSSLKEILANGIKPLEKYYEMWTKDNYIKEFEEILYEITK